MKMLLQSNHNFTSVKMPMMCNMNDNNNENYYSSSTELSTTE